MIDTDSTVTTSAVAGSGVIRTGTAVNAISKTARRPLTELLSRPPSDQQLVAVANGQLVSWQQLRQHVDLWQQRLADHSGDTLAVFLHDSLEFTAVLLALWHSNKTALLTGDCLPATVQQLQGQVSGLIGDFAAQDQLSHLRLDPAAAPRSPLPAATSLRRDQLAVIVLTSGSTGEPKSVPFRLGQLDDELAIHEQLWGKQAGAALVVGTVSHQHIYGLLWRVLWPLTGNRPLLSECCHYPEDLLAHASRWPQLVLITTPTHLTRLPENFRQSCAESGSWPLVISSTAPLAADSSRSAGDQLGTAITEIYGSSETGGIAWRRQAHDVNWQALPGISLRAESATGALQLRSPLLGHDDWITTSDRVELVDSDRFRLLGRLDRIAKVEGKRVSLSAMEQHLLQHAWLDEVAVLMLDGRRSETAVVARLSADGQQALLASGKVAFNRQLREWLAQRFEAPVLPRRWRVVEALPRNAQGKLPLAALQALFDAPLLEAVDLSPAPEATAIAQDKNVVEQSHLPLMLSCQKLSPQSVQLHISVPADLIWFDGHFPGAPILPGVVQLHWAAHFAVQHLGTATAHFSRMEVIKFQQVIRPGQAVTIELSWNTQQHKLNFRYFHGEQAFSSGRLVFDTPASETKKHDALKSAADV